MKRRDVRQSGSALIITLLLVTVLVAIGFSASRLTISEITQSTQLEDSELAYQAAEAGVEMGLLYYRYNRNTEVPDNVAGGVTAETNQVLRYNINTETNSIVTRGNVSGLDPKQSYFDLKMYHRNNNNIEQVNASSCDQKRYEAELCVAVPEDKIDELCIGNVTCYEVTDANDANYGKTFITPALAQDVVVEYDVEGVDEIKLEWEYLEDVNNMTTEQKNNVNLLLLPINENGEIIPDNKASYSYNINARNISTLDTQRIRFKAFGANLKSYTLTSSNPSDIKIDSRYTIIESTGYYGNAKRKLKVKLDRATGSLLSPYDFLIYSSQ